MPPVCLPSIFFLFPNSQLVPKCTKHCVFTGKCNLCGFPSHFSFYSLIRNLFQTAKKHCVFTGKCCMCLSSHFFLFPNSQLIPTCAKHVSLVPFFSYSLIRNLFLSAQNIVFSQVNATFVLPVPFFSIP